MDAHRALAEHFASRETPFPLDPPRIPAIAAQVATRFPDAVHKSRTRAERILEGRYDLLGYSDLPFGHPPRWNRDPVHGRTAAGGFWAAVPYLDPASGDHKVIWEINRHQYWLTLARAFHLTGDRRFYDAFVDQLNDWLRANPPLTGVNWASMLELGFRSLSWMWALHFFAPVAAAGTGERSPWIVDLLVGLDRQLTHIEHNLSRYFSPNTHLTGEALALYVAGAALPELATGERRRIAARQVLISEIDRQIAPDGGHAELSAHYHRYSTDFYLMAVLAARGSADSAAGTLEAAARAQARYLRTIADGAGRLPLIGDDDGGQLFPMCGRPPSNCADTLASAALILDDSGLAVGAPPEETFWLCGSRMDVERLPGGTRSWPSAALAGTGYFVSRGPAGDQLVFDMGRHGYLNGGHAHSDALSVVASVSGRALLVDPGTATYTMDAALRDRFRSTAMHNTIVVDGRPQAEPLGPFHWRTTCDAEISLSRRTPGLDYAEARHRAYRPIVHVRSILALHGIGWFIVDHLLGPGTAVADAHWHLDPSWQPVSAAPGLITLQHADGRIHGIAASDPIEVLSGAEGDALGLFAPVYGRVERSTCLRQRSTGALPRTHLTFIPLQEGAASAIDVQRVAVTNRPPGAWQSGAFRVTLDGTAITLLAAVESDGRQPADDAAPSGPWGTPELTTDGRVALVVTQANGRHSHVVNGRGVEPTGVTTQPYAGLNRA